MKKFRRGIVSLWKDRTLILMALPAVILMILFNYVPMTGLILAFKNFDYSLGLYKSPWNGLENFRHLFLMGDTYWRITRNTIGYYLLFTIFETICSIALAIGINELAFKRIGKYAHSIMIMPTFISYVAVTYIVKALLDYNNGMVNRLLEADGASRVNFYMQANLWPFILVVVYVWKMTGYSSVLYLSALAGIDQELYESAALDGANAWAKMRYITLPMLVPIITVKFLLGLGNIMHSETGIFYQVTRNTGALYKTTQVLDSYVLNSIMTASNFGVTAATTFYQSVIGFIMVITVNAIVKKMSPENSLF